MLLPQHYSALFVMYPCVFSPLPSFLCVRKRMWLAACVGLVPVWHIWMCLARPKFLNETNPQPLHNPPLLCNDCCSSLQLHSGRSTLSLPHTLMAALLSWLRLWSQNIDIWLLFSRSFQGIWYKDYFQQVWLCCAFQKIIPFGKINLSHHYLNTKLILIVECNC